MRQAFSLIPDSATLIAINQNRKSNLDLRPWVKQNRIRIGQHSFFSMLGYERDQKASASAHFIVPDHY